jgi:peptidoglycan glycosyltransferase
VSASFNSNAYSGGTLTTGTLTDRNGVVLAGITDGKRTFADNADVRKATLHVVGDLHGNIGTGALTVYASKLIGYNIINGTYSRAGKGKTVALTIDSRLNVAAYKALNGRRGAVMVMNYKTGEVLCMVPNPSFNPASQPKNIDSDPAYEGAYLNRAISADLTPGSVYKLLTAAAAIENISDVFDRDFKCEGKLKTAHGTVTCSKTHGSLNFEEALTVSCNSVFGELALELGADTLAKYAEKYGLSERTTVGGISTAKGDFVKAEQGTADLAWSGIGQYNDTVCPAAMLRLAGAIANGGKAVKMNLLKKPGVSTAFSGSESRIMRSDTADKLGAMMDYSVHQKNIAGNFPGLEIHAKTGTAEVGGGKNSHAWFTGYITNEGYPLAFVVVVENGGGGFATASPVANKVLQAAIGD